ncbi:MAG: LUD domain-containing protein [Alphaproteobacteria bacterium]|nr:LUD domain-containing protein [Alphaproteobacteria bacterium]
MTLAEGGVAETGSLVFRSGAETPMLHNFLGLHHIAVVRKDGIGRYLESVFGADAPALPRILTLVTGTSGTADIEAVNIRGARAALSAHSGSRFRSADRRAGEAGGKRTCHFR